MNRHDTICYFQYDCPPLGNSLRVPYRRKQQVIWTRRIHPCNVNMKHTPWPNVRPHKQERHVQERVTKHKSFLNLGLDWCKWCFMLQVPTGEDWIESTACLEMAAKGIKNSSFPTCSQLTMWHCSICLQTVNKMDCQLVLQWCISHKYTNPFS